MPLDQQAKRGGVSVDKGLNLPLSVELALSHQLCIVSLAKTVTTQLPRFFSSHIFGARYNSVAGTLQKLKFHPHVHNLNFDQNCTNFLKGSLRGAIG